VYSLHAVFIIIVKIIFFKDRNVIQNIINIYLRGMLEGGRWKAEGGRRKAEDGRRKAKVKRQK